MAAKAAEATEVDQAEAEMEEGAMVAATAVEATEGEREW